MIMARKTSLISLSIVLIIILYIAVAANSAPVNPAGVSKLTQMFKKAFNKVADVLTNSIDSDGQNVQCSRRFNDSMDSLNTTLEHMNSTASSDNNLTSYAEKWIDDAENKLKACLSSGSGNHAAAVGPHFFSLLYARPCLVCFCFVFAVSPVFFLF